MPTHKPHQQSAYTEMKMTTMASSFHPFSFIALLFVVLLFSAHHSEVKADAADPLLPICKTVGGGSTDFCMAALGSDERSRVAEESYRNLSTIAVDLLTDNVTSTAEKIDLLLEKGGGTGDPVMRKCLESCRALYRGIAGRQPACAAAVTNGTFKAAQASLQISAGAAKECEAAFGENHVESPLTVEDDNAFRLAKLADALLDHAT